MNTSRFKNEKSSTRKRKEKKKRKETNIYILNFAKKMKLIKKSHCNACIHYFSRESVTKLFENVTISSSHRKKSLNDFENQNFKEKNNCHVMSKRQI